MLPTVFTASESSISLQDILPSLDDSGSTNSKCSSFFDALGSILPRSRTSSPMNQPDFAEQGSEILGQDFGFEVIFLPKFHCELNFIEQCWGHAKRVYRQYPVSSKEEDLEKNLLTALESVPLSVVRKYIVALSFCYLMILISF